MGSDSYPNLGRFLDPDPNIDYLDPEDHNSCFTFLHTSFMGSRRTTVPGTGTYLFTWLTSLDFKILS